MRRGVRTGVAVAGALVALGGCGSSQQTRSAAGPPGTASLAPQGPVESGACRLAKNTEVAAALKVSDVLTHSGQAGGKQCLYTGTAVGGTFTVTVRVSQDPQDVHDFRGVLSSASSGGGEVRPVSGLGDAAFVVTSTDAVNVLRGGQVLVVAVGGPKTTPDLIDRTVSLARLVLSRLH